MKIKMRRVHFVFILSVCFGLVNLAQLECSSLNVDAEQKIKEFKKDSVYDTDDDSILLDGEKSIVHDADDASLNEETSIQNALVSNVEILECSQNVEYAEQKVKESKALRFPNVASNLNISNSKNAIPALISSDMSQIPGFLPYNKKKIHPTFRISIWEIIFSGGRIKTAIRLAIVNKERIEKERDIVKNKVVNAVRVAFNECLYYKELLKINLARVRDYKLGKIRISSSKIKELKEECIREQLCYEKKVLDLLFIIGGELNSIVKISGNLVPKIKQLDLNKCLFLAYQFKPELMLSQYQESIDNLTLNLLSLQKHITVTLGSAWEWDFPKFAFKGANGGNWIGMLNFYIPIFDGGGGLHRIKEKKIKLRQSVLMRVKSERNIRLCVTKAFLDYNFWKNKALNLKLQLKDKNYNKYELKIIRHLNKSYYNLEFAVGTNLDAY
jgi:hypothetical protein